MAPSSAVGGNSCSGGSCDLPESDESSDQLLDAEILDVRQEHSEDAEDRQSNPTTPQ